MMKAQLEKLKAALETFEDFLDENSECDEMKAVRARLLSEVGNDPQHWFISGMQFVSTYVFDLASFIDDVIESDEESSS